MAFKTKSLVPGLCLDLFYLLNKNIFWEVKISLSHWSLDGQVAGSEYIPDQAKSPAFHFPQPQKTPKQKLEPGSTGCRVWLYPRSGKINCFPLSLASKNTKRKTGAWIDRLQGLIISQIRQNHLLSTFLSLKKHQKKTNRSLDGQVAGSEYIPDQAKSPAFPFP